MSPIHPAEIASRDADQGILPGLRRILGTASPRACHGALAQTARLLEDEFGFSILMAAEIAPGPVIVWQSDGPCAKTGRRSAPGSSAPAIIPDVPWHSETPPQAY